MNPNTFEVLAIASYPTYDLTSYNADYNLLAQDPKQPLLNRAINGTFAPGSTLKPGMAAISLIDGVISRYSHVTCTGRYKGTVGCSTYGTNHVGSIDIIDAIAYSCNSFFCELGNLLGIEKMENYLRAFGLGQSTGLELGGSKGILAGPTYRGEIQSPELWQPGMTWQAAIGQSDHQLSPVQMACYIATLCNGGTRYTAHLLHSVYRFGSSEPSFVYQQSEDTVLSRIEISQGTLDTVFAGMKKVVSETASVRRWINSNTIPVTVGGKTGTAQTGGVCDNALFVAAAPYDDPDIVISVVLEKGYSGGLPSLTAARILEAYYSEQ
jgi:penicillin-binding protein 2